MTLEEYSCEENESSKRRWAKPGETISGVTLPMGATKIAMDEEGNLLKAEFGRGDLNVTFLEDGKSIKSVRAFNFPDGILQRVEEDPISNNDALEKFSGMPFDEILKIFELSQSRFQQGGDKYQLIKEYRNRLYQAKLIPESDLVGLPSLRDKGEYAEDCNDILLGNNRFTHIQRIFIDESGKVKEIHTRFDTVKWVLHLDENMEVASIGEVRGNSYPEKAYLSIGD